MKQEKWWTLPVGQAAGHPNPRSPGGTVQDKNSQTATLTTELVRDSFELNLIL